MKMGLYQNSFWDLATFKCPTLNSNPKQTSKYFWFSKFYHNCWWIFRRCFLLQSEAAILRFNFPDLQLIEFLFDHKKLISIFRYGKMPWPHSFDFRCQFLEKFINIQSFFSEYRFTITDGYNISWKILKGSIYIHIHRPRGEFRKWQFSLTLCNENVFS